ncbi:MAG: hypothetical protein KBF21_07645 [Thermoanaerobaculia bacterium]|nr:hypothetical protein [Thermoanaerobaculia bacterium]
MARDPLTVFLNEKTAADLGAPSTAATLPPASQASTTSMDPGERAIASLVATGAAPLARRLALMGGGWALGKVTETGSEPWHDAFPLRGAPSFAKAEIKERPSKLLGLFDVSARVRPIREGDQLGIDAMKNKVDEVHHVVDSFIDKHQLERKGVTLNFHNGLLGENGYNIGTKEVALKSIGKEHVLHELGHAADYTGSAMGRLRGRLGPILERGAYMALPIALIAGDHIKKMLPGTIDDKAISFMQDHAPAIMGATLAATQLYPEAKASALAISHIAKTEGSAAARLATKRLGASFGTYLLSVIPPIVGMALARKYMRQARAEAGSPIDLEKQGGVADYVKGFAMEAGDIWGDLKHIGTQVGSQAADLITHPGTARRVAGAAKDVGTSPEFVAGAMRASIPSTLGALYLYGTPAGKHIRDRMHPSDRDNYLSGNHDYELLNSQGERLPGIAKADERWREQHPMRFAGLVGLGSALAGGIVMKLVADLKRVL